MGGAPPTFALPSGSHGVIRKAGGLQQCRPSDGSDFFVFFFRFVDREPREEVAPPPPRGGGGGGSFGGSDAGPCTADLGGTPCAVRALCEKWAILEPFSDGQGDRKDYCVPILKSMGLGFLLSPKTQIMSENKLYFPLKSQIAV